MALTAGEVVDGKYRIVRLLGEGGMGAVYEGENVRIRRRVAIKVLHAALSENAEIVLRFEREAEAAGRIGNDHILEVLDLGALPTGDRYIVMEFLDGEPLSSRIERLGHLTVGQLVPIMRQVLEGLAAAHGAGIIHRDLKPDNIFLLKNKAGQKDFAKIIDFGISKFNEADNSGVKVTRAGSMMGTPLYMSPEQASGSAEADARSDIYAIGVIMYEALAGRVPFTAQQFNELLFQIVLGEVKPLVAVANIDPEFSDIVAKAMAKKADERFQTCHDFINVIDAYVATRDLDTSIGSQLATGGFAPSTFGSGHPGPTNTPYPGGPQGRTPGFGVATPGAATPLPVSPDASTSMAPTAKKSSGGLIAVLVLLVLLLVGGGVVGLRMLSQGDGNGANGSSKSIKGDDEPTEPTDDESKHGGSSKDSPRKDSPSKDSPKTVESTEAVAQASASAASSSASAVASASASVGAGNTKVVAGGSSTTPPRANVAGSAKPPLTAASTRPSSAPRPGTQEPKHDFGY